VGGLHEWDSFLRVLIAWRRGEREHAVVCVWLWVAGVVEMVMGGTKPQQSGLSPVAMPTFGCEVPRSNPR
jgi:hypothetical protein